MRLLSCLIAAALFATSSLTGAALISFGEANPVVRREGNADSREPCVEVPGDICIPIPSFVSLESRESAGVAWATSPSATSSVR
jgi:hypothetical protein